MVISWIEQLFLSKTFPLYALVFEMHPKFIFLISPKVVNDKNFCRTKLFFKNLHRIIYFQKRAHGRISLQKVFACYRVKY